MATPSPETPTLGQALKAAREALAPFSLRKAAIMYGVSAGFLSKLERDMIEPPSIATIMRIAAVLGVDAGTLIILAKGPKCLMCGKSHRPESKSLAFTVRQLALVSDVPTEPGGLEKLGGERAHEMSDVIKWAFEEKD